MPSLAANRAWSGFKLFLVLIPLIAAVGCCVSFYFWLHPLTPNLPPLLKDVNAGSDDAAACYPTAPTDASRRTRSPLSPTLESRLKEAFPPGTSEDRVIDVLAKQGFRRFDPCDNDPSVHAAHFRNDGLFFESTVTANVFWKVDTARNVLWMKAFVGFGSHNGSWLQ